MKRSGATAVVRLEQQQSLLKRLADRCGVRADDLLPILRDTVFKPPRDGPAFSNAEIAGALIIADRYQLDPFTGQIKLARDKGGGVLPIVPMDGWAALISRDDRVDSIDFEYDWDTDDEGNVLRDEKGRRKLYSVTAIIKRKDRSQPSRITEFMDECEQPRKRSRKTGDPFDGPWQTHPKRCLRHKALVQGGRAILGITGIYDDDEAERIVEVRAEVAADDGAKLPDPSLSQGDGNSVDLAQADSEPVDEDTGESEQEAPAKKTLF